MQKYCERFIHGWGSKKECLTKKGLLMAILDFYSVYHEVTMTKQMKNYSILGKN